MMPTDRSGRLPDQFGTRWPERPASAAGDAEGWDMASATAEVRLEAR
jgi:hypothetical protein